MAKKQRMRIFFNAPVTPCIWQHESGEMDVDYTSPTPRVVDYMSRDDYQIYEPPPRISTNQPNHSKQEEI